jgi:hypothetical protein
MVRRILRCLRFVIWPVSANVAEGDPVELWLDDDTKRIVARNESGCNCTTVDLLDLISWLRVGQCKDSVSKDVGHMLLSHLDGINSSGN